MVSSSSSDTIYAVDQDGGATISAVDQGGGTTISAVHADIMQTHIFTRLDGPSLAAAASASSRLRSLSTEERLWRDICNHAWPSTADPLVSRLISTFPAGHLSFFSDSFPSLDHLGPPPLGRRRPPPPSELVSAVDIHHRGNLLFSKVQKSETASEWFMCSPFRVDLLGPMEMVQTPVKVEGGEDTCLSNLEENLTLNWIVIDPAGKRSANFSSLKPVLVRWHWLTEDIQVRYATVLAGDRRNGYPELVVCKIVVTCGGKEGGDLHVKEVNLQVEDMDGKILSGKDSLVIMQEAMVGAKRKRGRKGEEKERYDEYSKVRREITERKERRERRLDMTCMAIGVTVFLALWAFILLR